MGLGLDCWLLFSPIGWTPKPGGPFKPRFSYAFVRSRLLSQPSLVGKKLRLAKRRAWVREQGGKMHGGIEDSFSLPEYDSTIGLWRYAR
jgi:hypothetical protein